MPAVSLRPPPDRGLATFPAKTAGARGLSTLYRIFHHHGPDGRVNRPWSFTSSGGRFDLPSPHGTCYWSDRRYGCWVERFRGTTLVSLDDVRRLRLWTAAPPRLRLANLLDRAGYALGLTAEVHTVADYTLPQEWAAALHKAGFDGVVGTCRHDPSSRARNIGVFGRAGTPRSQPGWRTTSGRLESDPVLAKELASLGVRIASIPYDVPTAPPPAP